MSKPIGVSSERLRQPFFSPIDALPAKRLAVAAKSRARAAGSWLLLVIRRLDKPVGPEATEIMGRLVELAMIDAHETVQNLRRLQTQLEDARL